MRVPLWGGLDAPGGAGAMSDLADHQLQLSEIDYPPCWPDRYSLRVTASGCLLTDATPGDFQVWLDEPRLLELFEAWMGKAPDNFIGVWLQADLAEAVDDFIAGCPEPTPSARLGATPRAAGGAAAKGG